MADTVTERDQRVLDPACGSGTFLVAALRKLASLQSKKKGHLDTVEAGRILEAIWGFDVNPLSVILARTNLYLALCSLLRGQALPAEFRPRVYVADTFVLPRFETAEQARLSEGSSSTKLISANITPQIAIPVLPGISPDEALRCVQLAATAFDKSSTVISNKTDSPNLVEYQNALLRAMAGLKARFGDGLWKFVLRNYGLPPLVRRSFDVVIGNPPWLTFREARKGIQDSIESIADDYGVTPPGQVKTSFNLAVAFFLASSHFLKKGGEIAMVLPLSVLDSPAHGKFITLVEAGKSLRATRYYDFGQVEPSPFRHNLQTAVVEARSVE